MDNPQHLRTHSYDFYVHDTWRVRPDLVINAGLRYEFNSPGLDVQNRADVYDPARGKIVPVARTVSRAPVTTRTATTSLRRSASHGRPAHTTRL